MSVLPKIALPNSLAMDASEFYNSKSEAIEAAKKAREKGRTVKIFEHKQNIVHANSGGSQRAETAVRYEVKDV